jgi:hypothetical protein
MSESLSVVYSVTCVYTLGNGREICMCVCVVISFGSKSSCYKSFVDAALFHLAAEVFRFSLQSKNDCCPQLMLKKL